MGGVGLPQGLNPFPEGEVTAGGIIGVDLITPLAPLRLLAMGRCHDPCRSAL